MAVEIVGNLIRIEFSSTVMPVCKEVRGKEYVYWGEDNNYGAFLFDLYRSHPEHNAIVKTKSKYIYGKGLGIAPETNTIELAKGQSFLSRANRFEDWNSVYEKTVKSVETFNGFVWQIIWELGGRRCEVYCMQLAKFRKSVCGKKVFYCNKWVDEKTGKPLGQTELDKNGFTVYDAFDPDIRTGTQIYYFQVPEQCTDEYGDVYPLPEYVGAIINIVTDIAISDFQNSLVENGMTAQGMLSLFNGTPTDEEKRKYDKLFTDRFTGPKNKKKVILNFVNAENEKGAEWTTFTTSDMDKQFELISKVNQQKIFTGHGVTNKSLFGIPTEGALSDRTAIDISFEQMQNTYTEPRQNMILGEIRMIGGLCGASLTNLEVKKLAPLGVNLTDPNISQYFTEDEIRESLGYKPKEKPTGQVDPNSVPQAQVNENIKNLTGRQWIHIKRLQREVQNGKTLRETAALMLQNGFGLTPDDINVLLPTQPGLFTTALQFSAINSDQAILRKFEELAEPENPLDEIVSEEFMGEPTVESKILDILKGDPTTSQDKIARMLGIEADLVKTTIDNLLEKGQVEISAGKVTVTDKGNNRNVPPVETEIYTVYKYVTREGVPRAKETRPFCKRLLELTSEGKVWSRTSIESITNDIGEPAWSYRGGWYTNPDTGGTTTHCRHVWKAITRSRTKNG